MRGDSPAWRAWCFFATRLRDPPAKAQPRHIRSPWPEINSANSPGRQAVDQCLSTHQHRLEGARIAPSVTIDAGATASIYTEDHRSALVLVRLLSQRHDLAGKLFRP